jgi:hypothetical protein
MYSVAGGGYDTLPRAISLGVLLDMALGANHVRHGCVRPYAFRTLRHPLVQLTHIGGHSLLMAVVAAELGMLARRELAERLLHNVTTCAEVVVVHHEVPSTHTGKRGTA